LLIALAMCSFDDAWVRAKVNAETWNVCDYDSCKFRDIEAFKATLIQPEQLIEFYSSIDSIEENIDDSVGAPDNYDPRTGPKANCYSKIRDQGQCGSCWAFAAATTLTDRLCLLKNTNVILSPQDLVSCDTTLNKGCDGGNPIAAWEYIALKGIVSDACYPYTSGNGVTGKCLLTGSKCPIVGETYHKYKTGQPKLLRDQTVIKTQLLTGSIEATMMVYDDFPSYESGIYVKTSSNLLGGHAVRMIGYGVDTKTSLHYWIVANSWSESWGEQGYFRIKTGECSIDSACTYADPK
jgi:cathepsin B